VANVRVLIVDDEVGMTTALARGLSAEGLRVEVAADGRRGLELAAAARYDAIILDIMLPRLSGYEVLKVLRASSDWTPVLMLSAKDGEYDLADALDLGADDYLVKPFSYVVLLARLRALARRGRRPRPVELVSGPVRLDPSRRSVSVSGADVALTPREYRLLETLMRRDGAAVSKTELLVEVFDANPDGAINVVEVYVGYLRRKLGAGTVVTVHGGYRMAAS
jgi:two-component system OmpR family response regulator